MRRLPKLDLNITNRCNYRCKHCAFDSGVIDMKELTVPKLTKILKDTKELGGEGGRGSEEGAKTGGNYTAEGRR